MVLKIGFERHGRGKRAFRAEVRMPNSPRKGRKLSRLLATSGRAMLPLQSVAETEFTMKLQEREYNTRLRIYFKKES